MTSSCIPSAFLALSFTIQIATQSAITRLVLEYYGEGMIILRVLIRLINISLTCSYYIEVGTYTIGGQADGKVTTYKNIHFPFQV